ncbi:hypothetical protein JW758_01455 [Candidatus Peregrinibacteria bacterium]|nr:hypothetical protein [Candidatus Peregrinibacteria bacterium]
MSEQNDGKKGQGGVTTDGGNGEEGIGATFENWNLDLGDDEPDAEPDGKTDGEPDDEPDAEPDGKTDGGDEREDDTAKVDVAAERAAAEGAGAGAPDFDGLFVNTHALPDFEKLLPGCDDDGQMSNDERYFFAEERAQGPNILDHVEDDTVEGAGGQRITLEPVDEDVENESSDDEDVDDDAGRETTDYRHGHVGTGGTFEDMGHDKPPLDKGLFASVNVEEKAPPESGNALNDDGNCYYIGRPCIAAASLQSRLRERRSLFAAIATLFVICYGVLFYLSFIEKQRFNKEKTNLINDNAELTESLTRAGAEIEKLRDELKTRKTNEQFLDELREVNQPNQIMVEGLPVLIKAFKDTLEENKQLTNELKQQKKALERRSKTAKFELTDDEPDEETEAEDDEGDVPEEPYNDDAVAPPAPEAPAPEAPTPA